MQKIIEEFRTTLNDSDVFAMWEKELVLRRRLREHALCGNIQVDSPEEISFVKRALYNEETEHIFFQVLYHNLQKSSIQNYLLGCPPHMMGKFLSFVAQELAYQHPSPRNMQFIINIYREEFNPLFTDIVAALPIDVCKYLLARTANKTLRGLLKNRLADLEKEKGRSFSGNPAINPEVQEDQNEMLQQALALMERIAWSRNRLPEPAEVPLLLEITELLFKAGLIEDSLRLLAFAWQYGKSGGLPNTINDNLTAKLVRKTLGIYTVLNYPLSACESFRKIYGQYFHPLGPDKVTLLFLNIFDSLIHADYGSNRYARWEIQSHAARISDYRSDDLAAHCMATLDSRPAAQLTGNLLKAAHERFMALPLESFVIVEFVRFLYREGIVILTAQEFLSWSEIYLRLYRWVPHRAFANQKILEQFLAFSKYRNYKELDSIVKLSAQANSDPAGRAELDRDKLQEMRSKLAFLPRMEV